MGRRVGIVKIRSWACASKPVNERGHYIQIVGQRADLGGWVLGLLGVDTQVSLAVGLDRVEFSRADWTGHKARILPLERMEVAWYGYDKPWLSSLLMLLAATALALGLDWSAWISGLGFGRTQGPWGLLPFSIGLLVALMNYASGRALVLGLRTTGRQSLKLRFQRTALKGVEINEDEARRVCKVLHRLMDAKLRTRR